MTTAQRIRRSYGSIRAALQHCIFLNLSVAGTARQLETSPHWVKTWEKKLNLQIRRGTPGENQTRPEYNPSWENIRRYNARRQAAKGMQ